MDIALRPAQRDDAAALAEICLAADPEIFDFLYHGLLPGNGATALVKFLCVATDNMYSYEHFTLAVGNGEVLGGFNAVPTQRLAPLEWNLELILRKRLRLARWSMVRWYMRRIALAARAETIPAPPNSFFISNLAVFPRYRGQGVARALLEAAVSQGETNGLGSLSLFVWDDREDAVRLYLRNGFRVEQAGRFKQSTKLPHSGRALMVRWLDPHRTSASSCGTRP